MNNNELLLSISNMLDNKLEEVLERKLEEKLEEILDRKLEEKLEEILDRKLDEKLKPLYERMDRLEERMDKLEEHINRIDERLTYVELTIENEILPQLKLLAENYVPAAKKYSEKSERIDTIQSELNVVRKIVEVHSKQIDELQKIS